MGWDGWGGWFRLGYGEEGQVGEDWVFKAGLG